MIELKNLNKTFKTSNGTLHAVRDVNLTIPDGEVFGIIGFSGAGKSTLVRCINLLERPTSGSVIIDGTDLTKLSRKELRQARKKIGMIFQQFNLLSQRTVEANVRYPMEISGKSKQEASKRTKELLEIVGLLDKASSYPAQLSGGQKQRVAIARALASDPDIILCDEATSALDPITTRAILDLLRSLNSELGVTIVVITHEMKVVEQICDRVAVMSDGEIKEQGSVRDVFLRPQSATARKLIDPGRQLEGVFAKNTLRLAFTGEESGAPVISDMTIKCNAMVSILSANTENIGGKSFGQMLIQMPDDEEACERIKEYLRGRNIFFETGYEGEAGQASKAGHISLNGLEDGSSEDMGQSEGSSSDNERANEEKKLIERSKIEGEML